MNTRLILVLGLTVTWAAFVSAAYLVADWRADAAVDTTVAQEDVDVLGIDLEEEFASFQAMVAPWEVDTGATMSYTGAPNFSEVLEVRVEEGNPPDVAISPAIGSLQQFARAGELIPLSACASLEAIVLAEYPQTFIDLGTVDGVLYGFPLGAQSKGTIWYNPPFFADHSYQPLAAESTFQDLIKLTKQIRKDGALPPWSIGVESGEASGWPGTDWIQQIILNEPGGEEVYDGLIDGSVRFTHPLVRDAWKKFGEIALKPANTAQGSPAGINATFFGDSTFPPFESPPDAAMVYLGEFARNFFTEEFPGLVAGTDFDFFPWPGGAVTGAANIVFAFNADETTCSFLEWLAGAEAQEIRVGLGGFTSVNTGVSLESYPPDPVARAIAQQLITTSVFRFDLDDAMGGELQDAFWDGVVDYLANPQKLGRILAGIEAARLIEE